MRYLYAAMTMGALLACWGAWGKDFSDAAAIAVVLGVPLLVARRRAT